nr:MAG: hypothetical protein 2 [Hubei sediment noda-like virus 1]
MDTPLRELLGMLPGAQLLQRLIQWGSKNLKLTPLVRLLTTIIERTHKSLLGTLGWILKWIRPNLVNVSLPSTPITTLKTGIVSLAQETPHLSTPLLQSRSVEVTASVILLSEGTLSSIMSPGEEDGVTKFGTGVLMESLSYLTVNAALIGCKDLPGWWDSGDALSRRYTMLVPGLIALIGRWYGCSPSIRCGIMSSSLLSSAFAASPGLGLLMRLGLIGTLLSIPKVA